ncbi:MAG: HDIG domain-containing protein [Bacteroidales bacterium]|nr:HDIG domain-containing protein [Bacteroidales bacterium]
MSGSEYKDLYPANNNQKLIRFSTVGIVAILAVLALIFPFFLRESSYFLSVGDVADRDLLAPYDISYQSDVRTENARIEAEKLIPVVYLPADPRITRLQIEKLHITINYINSVRQDSYATSAQKISDITAASNLNLTQEKAQQLLSLTNTQWSNVQQECLRILEQIMRDTIQEDRLFEAQRNIPSLVSFSMPLDQAEIISEITASFIVPNSLYSEEETLEVRSAARSNVEPVLKAFAEGETIVERGQVITQEDWEALQKFNLIKPENSFLKIFSAAILVIIISYFTILYFKQEKFNSISTELLITISALFILFLIGARLIIFSDQNIFLYLYPLPAFGITLAIVYRTDFSLILNILISIIAAYALPDSLELTLFYIFTGMCGILVLNKGRRIADFFYAGLIIFFVGFSLIIVFELIKPTVDYLHIFTLLLFLIVYSIASSSLSLLLQFVVSRVLNLSTPLRLFDISRTDHPLLQKMLRDAPGTYQHSLQVANLAEQAAKNIGANTLLVRVGCLFHDIGKSANPSFFIENQLHGQLNPHDSLDPYESSEIIVNHVTDGLELAKKYRFPDKVINFISEHHGTMLTNYQYTKAVQEAGNDKSKVDEDFFRYPGPAPQSKETAILMLADGCEARARALLPNNEDQLRSIIKDAIEYIQKNGQLDFTHLTINDLYTIQESFVKTLINTHHIRIKYPKLSTTKPKKLSSTN